MPIVDIHVHVYPDKIAAKASASVGEFYHVTMEEPVGSVGRLREIMDDSPITHALVHSVAVRPQTVTSINTFIAETIAANDQLIGFMTLHQDFEDPASEIERATSLGLRGVKLHPDTQEVNLDDERLMRIYEICERKGLPVMLHCGDYRYDYSHPRRLKNVLHTFPNLVVDAAHFGGWSVYGLALEYLEDESCFLDVSSSMRYLGSRRTYELCERHGFDRILFGSDYPMWNPAREHAIFSALGFTERDFEAMCWHNAERFVGTDIGR